MIHKYYETAEVISHSSSHGVYTLVVDAPQIATTAKPGQFVLVYLGDDRHLLGRPISICDANKRSGSFTMKYVIAGAGTQIMSSWQPGHFFKVLGPLGNGFDIRHIKQESRVALMGGGIGIPPLYLLAKELKKIGALVDVYLGFKQEIPTLVQCFDDFSNSINIVSEDGNSKNTGYVTDFLPETPAYDTIFSCGPIPMLAALARYSYAHNIACQVSVEERMACGLGACKGCVVKTFVESKPGYQLCCQNGPVFDSKEVIWNE